ncbi:restriction endonuclease subunit S [Streptomyces thermovulgaris]|uniref:restriction endonuclease subunit S n=1 Tax=Streptomyces thermovulgaris TaxID=1934 RepID=UPI000A37374B|nr:restriction endonuclease subunit S [Streptomyces thermovulgaris]
MSEGGNPSELPKGWVQVRLDEIAEVRLGRQRSPKNHSGTQMRPYLRAANVDWNGLKLDDVKEMNFTDDEVAVYGLKKGDILLSEASGSASEVGKPAIWNDEIADCCFQNTLIRVRSYGVDPGYLLHFLRSEAIRGAFVKHSRGVGIHHLGAARLAAWQVPVPPLEEQRRIVSAVEEYLTQLARAESVARAGLQKLTAYAGQLLRHACDGRLIGLTAAEEQVQPTPADCIDGDLPRLPGGWAWARLEEIADVVGGITKDSKRQSDPKLVEVPYLRVANVQRGRLDLSNVSSIRATPDKIAALSLRPGDVLLNEGGDRDKLGRGWIWEGQIDNCIHQNHVFRARVRDEVVDPKIIAWHANSFGRRWFEVNGKQSVNLASISLKKIRQFPVPVPPSDVQEEIVKETERRLSVIEKTEAAIRSVLGRVAIVRRSLLAEAFAGRLVPQDPADEPAEALLDRIRAEREAAGVTKSRRRSPRRAPAQRKRTPGTASTLEAPPPPRADAPALATATQPTLDLEISS